MWSSAWCIYFSELFSYQLCCSRAQVFSNIDRILRNQAEEKEDTTERTKNVTLTSVESLNWSSEYSEM